MSEKQVYTYPVRPRSLLMSRRAHRWQWFGRVFGQGLLFLVTSLSALAVLFIFYFIAKDAAPFFLERGGGFNLATTKEFFTGLKWYPSADPPQFGAVSIFYGSAMVTVGAVIVAVPLGIAAAVCLSDVLPFAARQVVKPVIEVLAAIPSVAYGFFALVVFAPILQERGSTLLSVGAWVVLLPVLVLVSLVLGDVVSDLARNERLRKFLRPGLWGLFGLGSFAFLYKLGAALGDVKVTSGANAFNVSIILGIMALPTVVSVSEDALQAAGRELREGSYALGATRAETLLRTVIPAAISGICAAVILGIMRAVGETMVVWMASGNAAQVPSPFFNFLSPVRTLTATIAGDMGEADHVTGSYRYSVLFAMALCLLTFSFLMNLASEWVVRRSRRKLGKEV
jgi:phosphate transport system permease protein